MSETERRLAAVLAADVAGYSRLAGVDEERTLARLRALRGDLIDPAIAAHRGRVVKRAGDGTIVEFRSVIDAVRCALEVQQGMVERNRGLAPERQILFRVGIHIGDVVGEADGDLMGDGVNIAARLEGICKPGGLVLSEDAYRQTRNKIDLAFTDLGTPPLKNITEPIRVYALQIDAPSPLDPRPAVAVVSSGSQAVSVKGAQKSRGEPNKETPPRLSIVVLPFANIGGDPEQNYFVDGVTESLTTDLSRIRNSFVIGRHTAFSFKGKAVDLKQVGRELGVRYVLEGSVQRHGKRIRVNVQLIDAESGAHLWAERFDRDYGDLFQMQDEIVARLANQLNTQLHAAEAHRAERSVNPDSMDLYFRAMAAFNRGLNPATFAEARDLFQQALALDPANVEALTGLGYLLVMVAGSVTSDEPRAALVAAAENAANRALSLAPDDAAVHAVLGMIYGITARTDEAIAEAERAILLNPSMMIGYGALVTAKLFGSRSTEVEDVIMQAVRLSPRDTYLHIFYACAGIAKFYLGENEEAVRWFKQSIAENRFFPNAHWWMAATLGCLGRLEEGREAIRATLALDPTFSIRRLMSYGRGTTSFSLEVRERLYDGLRKAGVPEG